MFRHRLLLGWVNDNSLRPRAGKPWPIIDLDEDALKTYAEYFPQVRDLGYTAITLWGLFVSHAWPVPLVGSAFGERRKAVEKIARMAEANGLRLIHGFGAYGWGFEEIIRHDPSCARNEGRKAWGAVVEDNGLVMCYHEPSAREWMRRVIELTIRDFGATGISLQAGDLGRCYCHECRQLEDLDYYSRVVDETAAYARSLSKGLLVGHSCWGVNLVGDPAHLQRLARNLDFLTDVTDDLGQKGPEARRAAAKALPCALGSLGGAVFVPPQRWERDRWFLPHARYSQEAIRRLAEEGCTAFEFFIGPLNNPQYDLMTRFVGLALERPMAPVLENLGRAIEHLYGPRSASFGGELAQVCLDVEAAYLAARGFWPSGEFDYEPLKTEVAGPAIYLSAIPMLARAGLRSALVAAKERVEGLAVGFSRGDSVLGIAKALGAMVGDLDGLG